ncbi:MAG: type II toxin-antitoxin system HicA family toxin [Ardenticatenia bacterium]|nr:type II toxin-antitoxin system HicA family toxin [Ardenticatenia bacterium]
MRYRVIAKRLRDLGCHEIRQGKGSHRIWYNPATGKVAAVPDWGSKDLVLTTVRAILRELGINRREFGPIK